MKGVRLQDAIQLVRGSVLRVDDGAGALLCVWAGELWLTEQDSAEDHVLVGGQSLRLARGGAALGHAFRRCTVTLSPLRGAQAPARVLVLHRGGVEEIVHQRPRGAAALLLRARRMAARLLPPHFSAGDARASV